MVNDLYWCYDHDLHNQYLLEICGQTPIGHFPVFQHAPSSVDLKGHTTTIILLYYYGLSRYVYMLEEKTMTVLWSGNLKIESDCENENWK